jgi:hypothetical protein
VTSLRWGGCGSDTYVAQTRDVESEENFGDQCARGFWDDDSDEAYEGALSRAVTVEVLEFNRPGARTVIEQIRKLDS